MKIRITEKIVDYIMNNMEPFKDVMPVKSEVYDVKKSANENVGILESHGKKIEIPYSLMFSNITKIIIK